MLTQEQIEQINHSFKHGDAIVFQIERRGVFVADRVFKHRKEATIEFRECYEVDETCFEGNNYYGETLGDEKNFILDDAYVESPNTVGTFYYADEIKEEF